MSQEEKSLRSIPACAGEPGRAVLLTGQETVYPRVCGGTFGTAARVRSNKGLSPRVRGNPPGCMKASPNAGSIPACAGEPLINWDDGWYARVYPRVCGGTKSTDRCSGLRRGLSPRVRGNQILPIDAGLRLGSIPACAGEPTPDRYATHPSTVYPRVCGGTGLYRILEHWQEGLSPRVRGNRWRSQRGLH